MLITTPLQLIVQLRNLIKLFLWATLSLPCQTATPFSSFVSIMSEVRYVLMFMTSGTALCPLLNN